MTIALHAQTPAPTVPSAPPSTATATPWVQASPPPTPEPPAKPANVVIRVDKEGRYFFDKEKDALPADALTGRLRSLHEAQGDRLHLVIRADQDANYSAITIALDRARDAGVKNVSFSVPAGKATPPVSASPAASPIASPSREEIARAMARKREEELTKPPAVSPPPAKPPRAEPYLSPDEREAYERNLGLWRTLPPEERQALRDQAAERIHAETEKAYQGSGLNLNDDQREVFALRYRQERRRLEREIQEKATAERARRLPEILERLKREFPVASPTANPPRSSPTPSPAPTTPAASPAN